MSSTADPVIIEAETVPSDSDVVDFLNDAPEGDEDSAIPPLSERCPFRLVTHKPGLVNAFLPFGAEPDPGVSVDPEKASQTLWLMTQDWAVQMLSAGVDLPQLTAPTPGWLAGLGREYLGRRCGTLRCRDVASYFAKHQDKFPDGDAQILVSTPGEFSEFLPPRLALVSELSNGSLPQGFDHLPGDSMIQLEEIVPSAVECRFWVARRAVIAHSPYRIGVVGWDSPLFLEMMLNPQGQQLTEQALRFASRLVSEVDGPDGYVLDVGVDVEGNTVALRAWPSWSMEPLSADPAGVYQSLVAAHDFDGRSSRWRWSPDRAVYDRSELADDRQDEEAQDGPVEDSSAEEAEEVVS